MATRELKKIDVVSFAVVIGLVDAVIGFIMAIITLALGFSFLSFMGPAAGSMMALGAFGLLAVIIYPVVFFIAGFIGAAIVAIVYNFVASRYKGILIELA